MKNILFVFGFLLLASVGKAQEFNCKVRVNTPKLQDVDPKVFRTLEGAIQEFMNTTNWTEDNYEPHERIECNIQINILDELSPTSFSGSFSIQASRPIYGASQSTVIFEHADKDLSFQYIEFQPIEFTENSFSGNLSSMLSFYAYLILGMDYDSFTAEGGSDYFQKAQEIMNNVPRSATVTGKDNSRSAVKGWKSTDGQRNRYWIMESWLNPRVSPLRNAMYDYHRLGLDIMHDDTEKGKEAIVAAMEKVKQVNSAYPNAMATQMFVNAKGEEILDIFLQATSIQKRTIYAIMVKIDPSNASDYAPIRR